MAKNNMTFTTSLRLNSEGFKKGVKDVQKSLNSLKNSFLSLAGALGAGLGFTKLVSSLKDTAVQLSVAKSVLENVSYETKTYTDGVNKMDVAVSNFNENLEYSKRLAKDYHQDLVSIIENFAQFHAACQKTNLGLEDQKDVFEALTKAAAYYHLSADKAKDMMTAITQMMSKGKVSSEELRRQLGNVLPGAFNLMAAALGVSNAELEDMMKKGQVLSAEALPRFAAMLNTVTKSANFDSIQLQMNDLKNAWYELVNSSGFERLYSKIIKGTTNVISYVGKNFKSITAAAKGVVASILSFKLFDALRARGEQYIKDTEKQLSMLQRSAKKYVDAYNKALAMTPAGIAPAGRSVKIDKDTGVATGNIGIIDKHGLALMKEYNDIIIKQAKLKRDLFPIYSREWQAQNNILQEARAVNAEIARAAPELAANTAATKLWQQAWAGIVSIAKQIGTVLKSMGIMAIVSAILGVVTTLISKVKELRAEAKRVANIVEDYGNDMDKVNESVTAENVKLKASLAIVKDENQQYAKRVYHLKEINKALGRVGNSQLKLDDLQKMEKGYDKITAAVNRWCDATLVQAQIQAQAQRIAQAQARQQDIEAQKQELRTKIDEIEAKQAKPWNQYNPWNVVWDINKGGYNKQLENLNNEFKQEAKVVELAEDKLKELGVTLASLMEDLGGDDGQSDISKIFDKYNAELKELENQLKEGAITQEEFNEEFDKLVTKYFQSAAGTGALSIDAILEKADKGKALSKLEKWYKDLYEAAKKASFDAIAKLAVEAIDKSLDDAIDAMQKAMDDEMDKYLDKVIEAGEKYGNALVEKPVTKGKRDKTFDYKASASDVIGDEHRLSQERVEALQALIDKYKEAAKYNSDLAKLIKAWTKDLKDATKEANSFEKALKFAQIKEDIAQMEEEMNNLAYSGIKDMASSVDRVVKGMQNLKETMKDSDSTGWEQFIALFDTAVQLIDTVMSVVKMVQEMSKLSATLEGANIALINLENEAYAEQILLLDTINKLKGETISKTLKQRIADILGAQAAKASASANAGEAVAGATKSGAKLAFPYNLVAIAAGVAAVMVALSQMSKFAKGGIVGGNSFSGDKQVARVNSGEMILNKAQQGTLWNMLNGKGGSGGKVVFKISGEDLVGTLNNYNRLRR